MPPACASAAKRWPSSACWIPAAGDAKLGRERGQRADPEVLAEIDREREAFLAAQQGQASGELFSAIEGNYADAVRLLTTAHSAKFDGKATLFVAEKTRQEGMDPQVVWGPWVGELEVFSQNCAHVDIISPEAFEAIGPVVREILG